MATTAKLSDVVPSRFAHLTPSDETNIERIRADLESGSRMLLNVPHVFRNEAGKYELLAGHDRTEAWRRARPDQPLPIRDFTGAVNTDDAILAHFCRENLLRKDISKAAIAGEWLRKHPEWMDTRIAEHSGCVPSYVGEVRAELTASGAISAPNFRESETGEKRRAYKPRAERSPRPTPTKPKEAEPEDAAQMAAILTARTNPAPQAEAPKAPSVVTGVVTSEAESETPELPDGSTDGGTELPPESEVGAPTGVVSARPEVGPIVPEAGPVPELGTPAVEGGGVVEEAASLPESVSLALSIAHTPLTRVQLLALDDAGEARLLALGHWCQTVVAARRRARQSAAA